MDAHCLIFGYGYTAEALAQQLTAKGMKVTATSRNAGKPHHAEVQLLDFYHPEMESVIRSATHILISIPPQPSGEDAVITQHGEYLIQYAHKMKWLGYLSSTGVYGDYQGQWVDEHSRCLAKTSMALARLQAENIWFDFAQKHNLPLHVFRLAGIYGPKRNAIERILTGKKYSIFKEDQVFSRIHVDDIANTLQASMNAPAPMTIYNIADDEPASAHEIDRFAALLIGCQPLPLLPMSKADLSPMERAFYASNRRISNARIKKELKVRLNYPTYREGLTHLWRTDYESE